MYPRDAESGGTWVAADQHGTSLCLLNGAFEPHERRAPYPRSRGAIIPHYFQSRNEDDFIRETNWTDFEPFTLLIVSTDRLLEMRWDAHRLHLQELSVARPHIWSSTTLYSLEVRLPRQQWWQTWISEHLDKQTPILGIPDFHISHYSDHDTHNVLARFSEELMTLIITSVHSLPKSTTVWHLDRETDHLYKHQFDYESIGAS